VAAPRLDSWLQAIYLFITKTNPKQTHGCFPAIFILQLCLTGGKEVKTFLLFYTTALRLTSSNKRNHTALNKNKPLFQNNTEIGDPNMG